MCFDFLKCQHMLDWPVLMSRYGEPPSPQRQPVGAVGFVVFGSDTTSMAVPRYGGGGGPGGQQAAGVGGVPHGAQTGDPRPVRPRLPCPGPRRGRGGWGDEGGGDVGDSFGPLDTFRGSGGISSKRRGAPLYLGPVFLWRRAFHSGGGEVIPPFPPPFGQFVAFCWYRL